MIGGGLLSLRCEVAQPSTGWPVAATTGADNLVMTLWLRSLGDVQRLEAELAGKLPALTLTDRAVTLHAARQMGCLLDDTGRITDVVPIDPWASS
ncbi:hypothetical protein [Amycolatopsis sp. CA-126428]|uniref:hypothetical protein n=1 Tax=Amycolatopsis sp. CA-126428 TaxID=2073158 RepID=UPI001E4BD532|nr:hypothetical protein [Amycolatopsis sp. CA-126428]